MAGIRIDFGPTSKRPTNGVDPRGTVEDGARG